MITTGETTSPHVQGLGDQVQIDNRALRISFYGAVIAVVAGSGSMWTSGAVIYMPFTTAWFVFVEASSITAIIAGHIARRRAKRHRLPGRWWALLFIAVGWLCALLTLLVMLLVLGITFGIMTAVLA